ATCFFNDTTTTVFYSLSLHDALPISFFRGGKPRPHRCQRLGGGHGALRRPRRRRGVAAGLQPGADRGRNERGSRLDSCAGRDSRSEEHTSELQSRFDLVCRLLLEKKK